MFFRGLQHIYLNKLYSEKLISIDFNDYSSDQINFDAITGRTFIIPDALSLKVKYFNTESSLYEWVCGNVPNGLNNQQPLYWAENKGNNLDFSFNICISSKAKNPELLVKLIDNEYSSYMTDLSNWGKKGILYEFDKNNKKYLIPKTAEEFNKLQKENPIMSPLWKSEDREAQIAINNLLNPVPTVFNNIYEKTDYWKFSEKYINESNINPDASIVAKVVHTIISPSKKIYIYDTLYPIEVFIQKNIRKFITGEKSLDSWDEFVETAKRKGNYQSVLNIYNNLSKQIN